MAQKKLDVFSTVDIKLSELAKALSHPARIAILRTLAEKNMCICGEIVDVLPLAQSTVSQHLKELQKLGLVSGEIDGPKSCYCLNRDKLNEFADIFKILVNELNTDCC